MQMRKDAFDYSAWHVVKDILEKHKETRSGVSFMLLGDNTIEIHPEDARDIDDSVIANWDNSPSSKADSDLSEARRKFLNIYTGGGSGITDRTIGQLEGQIPTVTQALVQETGKTAFLGNGLSPVPLLLVDKFRKGSLGEPAIVVDCFDYEDILADMTNLNDEFNKNKVTAYTFSKRTFDQATKSIASLVDAVHDGSLITSRYFFGTQSPPDVLRNLSLAVNCYGPSGHSQMEQLSLLSQGGRLYTTSTQEAPPDFQRELIDVPQLSFFTPLHVARFTRVS